MSGLFDISILAESENGIIEIIFFVLIAAFGIIGTVVTNLRKKKQEQAEQQRLAELRDEAGTRNESDDAWTIVEQPPAVAPPVRAEKPEKVMEIGDFVKSARRRLVPNQEVYRPEPVPVAIPIPVPVQLKSATTSRPQMPSSRPPKIVHHAAKGKPSRLATPRNHYDIHSTVPCAGVSGPVYSHPGTTIRFDAAAARQAIIFHEIFSPPKALREQYELWD